VLSPNVASPSPCRAHRVTSPSPSSSSPPRSPTSSIGVTFFGCDPDEADLFERLAPDHGVAPIVTAAAPSEANLDLVAGNRCISISHRTPVPRSTLLALSRAGVVYVSTRSVGVDHVDVASAAAVGITVETVSYSADSVADFTLMLMLMAVRNATATVMRTAVHDYRQHTARGRELRDLTVGVVGTGRIGTAVIERLRGFGCRVLAHDRRATTNGSDVTLEELLRRSDIVTLHTPLSHDTHHLLSRGRIALMRRGAVVVNTGRGALVDTAALVDALETGVLGGAALDVLEGEDEIFSEDHCGEPPGNELLLRLHRLPNVLLTPHTAYFTDHALRDTVEGSLQNCVAFEGSRRRA
jgi:D-specific alpha-keto acid dehydrogenase